MRIIFRFSLLAVANFLMICGCGRSKSSTEIHAKVAPRKIITASSDNVGQWYGVWDKKNFVLAISEDAHLNAFDALARARDVVSRSLVQFASFESPISDIQKALLQRTLIQRLQLERQALRSDALNEKEQSQKQTDDALGLQVSQPSLYFLSVSDVRSALVELGNQGFSQAFDSSRSLSLQTGIKSFMSAMERSWNIDWIEPNLVTPIPHVKRTLVSQGTEESLSLAPEFKYNTSIVSVLKRVRADSAFSFIEKSKQKLLPITIAVLDTGVDSAHPELKEQMFVNPNEKEDGQDNDNNCYVDDVHGIDATSECGIDSGSAPKPGHADLGGPGKACPRIRIDDELSSNCGHGTHVAGIIAAKQGGDLSTIGICPSCKILSIRVAERCLQPNTTQARECVKPTGQGDPVSSYEVDGGISDMAQIRALAYIYNLRAPEDPNRLLVNVVNMSLGKYFASRSMSYLIRNLQRKNIIVAAAAGNDATETPSFPAAYDSVVAVCATSEDYAQGVYGRAPFSNYGDWVDICAPGTDIVSTVPGKTSDGGGLFIDKSGTSQATPFVAGALGYLLSYYGNSKSALQVTEMLKNTADSEILYNATSNRVPGTEERLYRACYSDTSTCDNLLGAGFLDLDSAIQGKSQSKTNYNFLKNQPGGCIVSSLAFRNEAGGEVSYGMGSVPVLLVLLVIFIRTSSLIKPRRRKVNKL